MAKDGSGEPAAKKLKQSQLCFSKSGGSFVSKLSNVGSGKICKSSIESKENTEKVNSDNSCLDGDRKEVCSEPIIIDDSNDENSSVPVVNEKVNLSPLQEKNNYKPVKAVSSGICDNELSVTSADKESSRVACHKDGDIQISEACNDRNVGRTDSELVDSSDQPLQTVTEEQSRSVSGDEDSIECDDPAAMCVDSVGDVSPSETVAASQSKDEKHVDTNMEVDGNNDCCKNENDPEDLDSTPLNISVEMAESSGSEKEDGVTSSGSTPVTPKSDSDQPKRRMTPKMIKRHEESVKKKRLQIKLMEEKRALKEKMKNEKLQQKMEEEEKRKQMKEERKKKRLAELELKNEEKRQKQEDKRMKKEKEEVEKKKKKELKAEEQRKEEMKKESEERKKEKAQAAFASFFKKRAASPGASATGAGAADSSSSATLLPMTPSSSSEEEPFFMPFPVKADMRLADTCRRTLLQGEKAYLDSAIGEKPNCRTYLEILKEDNVYKVGSTPATWPSPVSEELHDCIIIEAQVEDRNEQTDTAVDDNSQRAKKSKHRAKLLQFCENRRPAYFGTWTKRSKQVTPRRPFAKDDEGVMDYDVDSDSEWEEEEEGEDLENIKEDDNEAQEEVVEGGEDGYILDNIFVPHGYLSDEEQPDEDEPTESVEKQKDRLVALRREFDEEMKQGGAQSLKPKVLGCLWVSNSTTQVSKGSLYEVLLGHRAVWDESNGDIDMEQQSAPSSEKSPVQASAVTQFPLIVLQEIARMVHGSRWPLSRLVKEVGEVLNMARPQNPISRMALTRAIKHMAAKNVDSKENSVWSIKPECRREYKLEDLEEFSASVTPDNNSSRGKNKATLLDSFVRGYHSKSPSTSPHAKKRISLTPVLQSTPSVPTASVKVARENKVPEVSTAKKKVAFVTLPPRTPKTNQQKRKIPLTPSVRLKPKCGDLPRTPASLSAIEAKPHVDTPRPQINKFLKGSPADPSHDVITISDDSNL